MAWRYLAFTAPGGVFAGEIPLAGASLSRTLSGPFRLTGTIPVESPHLLSILRPWATTIWAEQDGVIRGGGILMPMDSQGSVLSIDCVGLSGYAKNMPWVGPDFASTSIDPLEVVRMIWAHLQGEPDGGLGVAVDAATSTVRVGAAAYYTTDEGAEASPNDALAADGSVKPGFRRVEAEPYRLNWWSTHDVGGEIDKLAELTPFDYLEHTEWASDTTLSHRLRLGVPSIGARRESLRFVIGENVAEIPALGADDEDYASDVLALGAGEERRMLRVALRQPGRGLRRVYTHVDKSATTDAALAASARSELGWRTGAGRMTSLAVFDHPHAPIGTFDVGDEVRVGGDAGWTDVDRWVRIVEMTIDPETDRVTLRVVEV